ncbi:uncharacterized protein PHACADRAFT_193951 [Phanerochaete carnosa HHB-10118-sp]|uniref:CxC5 like cysteine cluster associated with KDZ domain-containing protein n=1 Tax=Phanerochaete carnosa (strain HHB-10118-sp) TaxID=650164 RepID=K5WAX1_PHACS|nr:uncharacterized protein PHACADRAFT_193951 [Phanerochaete carnosa HHB-10118-sp]EKM56335.1 hypothetical protein PHACADRAFT_193951 [Phanerochaete carnosa HHB-10118-sp]
MSMWRWICSISLSSANLLHLNMIVPSLHYFDHLHNLKSTTFLCHHHDDDEADSASGQPELMLPDARRPDHGSYIDHVLAEEDEKDEEDEPHRPSELNEPVFTTSHHIKDLETAQQFITALQDAALETDLSSAVIERLRHPPQEALELEDATERLSIEVYLGLENASQHHYHIICDAILRFDPSCEMLSFDAVKRRIEELSGIVPVYHDMCFDSCVSFTGPFEDLEQCPMCSKHCYDQAEHARSSKKVPVKRFLTNCMGPAIQAMWRSSIGAEGMSYRARCTAKIMKEITRQAEHQDGNFEFSPPELDNYIHGTDYLEAALNGFIGEDDTVLMLSLDGAQLYCNKTFDVWIYIWVLMDRSPDTCYKKQNVYVGGVIPGPNKPKNIDSFLFPGFRHLAALMKEGLVVWNGATQRLFCSDPYIIAFGADQIGMTQMTGLVGHHGRFGHRLYCPFPGRCKDRSGHYFQATQLPHNHRVNNSDHPDVNVGVLINETYAEKTH